MPCGGDGERHAEADVEDDFGDGRSAERDDVEHRADGHKRETALEQSSQPRRAVDGRLGPSEHEHHKRNATSGNECVSGPVCEGEKVRVHGHQ